MDKSLRDAYEVVVGLEVHAQMLTKSKAYSDDVNAYGDQPKPRPVQLGRDVPQGLDLPVAARGAALHVDGEQRLPDQQSGKRLLATARGEAPGAHTERKVNVGPHLDHDGK